MNFSDCRTHQITTFVKAEILENLKAMCLPNGGWHLKYITHVRCLVLKFVAPNRNDNFLENVAKI